MRLCPDHMPTVGDRVPIGTPCSMCENQTLLVELEKLKDRYQGKSPKCHSGHQPNLPLALWDCPTCTDAVRKERDAALLRLDEARAIILALHKKSESYEVEMRAVKFLNSAVCAERWSDPARYGRATCGHVVPCPIHKPKDEPRFCNVCGVEVKPGDAAHPYTHVGEKPNHHESCDVNDPIINGKPCNCAPYMKKRTGGSLPVEVICDCGVPSCNKVSDHRK